MERIRKIIQEEIDKMLLFEEGGISDDVIKSTKQVAGELIEYIKNIPDYEWRETKYKGKVNLTANKYLDDISLPLNDGIYKDLFFEKLAIGITIVKKLNDKIPENVLMNSNRSSLVKRDDFNKENGKVRKAKILLSLCYNEKIDNPTIYGLIAHELSHLYEFYERKETKNSSKHDFYNNLHFSINEKRSIKNITFLFYCLCYFELNANIASLYFELYENEYTNDYNGTLVNYYRTNTYEQFLKYLQKPELILNKDFLKKFDEYDLKELNAGINKLFDDIEKEEEKDGKMLPEQISKNKAYHNKLKKEIYFDEGKDTLESYIERVEKICKATYDLYFKRVGRIITKAVDDKNKSFIVKERTDIFHVDAGLGEYLW